LFLLSRLDGEFYPGLFPLPGILLFFSFPPVLFIVRSSSRCVKERVFSSSNPASVTFSLQVCWVFPIPILPPPSYSFGEKTSFSDTVFFYRTSALLYHLLFRLNHPSPFFSPPPYLYSFHPIPHLKVRTCGLHGRPILPLGELHRLSPLQYCPSFPCLLSHLKLFFLWIVGREIFGHPHVSSLTRPPLPTAEIPNLTKSEGR